MGEATPAGNAIEAIAKIKADLVTKRKEVKELEASLADIRYALRTGGPKKSSKRRIELTPEALAKAEKKRGPRRGLPTTPPTTAPEG